MKMAALVLGLIGGIVGLPGALCSGACAAGITAGAAGAASDASNSAGNVFMLMGIVGSLLAIYGAIRVNSPGRRGAVVLLLATLINGVTLITLNPLSMLVVGLLLLATIFAFVAAAAEAKAGSESAA